MLWQMSLLRTAAILMLLATLPGSATRDPNVYELSFWPGKNVEKDPRYVRTEDGPFGRVVVARVRTLPLFQQGGALEPSSTTRSGTSGKVIRRWPMPVDASPIALGGEGLLVESGTLKFWVTPQGAITPYKGGLSIRDSEPTACGPSREFRNSACVQCRRYRDSASGKNRVLSFEGACT